MKFIFFILLFSISSIFSMELDKIALEEFMSNKKIMVTISEGKVDKNNLLFKRYIELSKFNEVSIKQEYANPLLQVKIKSFYNWISTLPEYQTAFEIAKTVNTQDAWDTFRKGNAPLVQIYFDQNGIRAITSSCVDFFNGNAHLNAEQVEKVVAQSFVIHYIRQLQRNRTSIVPSTIQIK